MEGTSAVRMGRRQPVKSSHPPERRLLKVRTIAPNVPFFVEARMYLERQGYIVRQGREIFLDENRLESFRFGDVRALNREHFILPPEKPIFDSSSKPITHGAIVKRYIDFILKNFVVSTPINNDA